MFVFQDKLWVKHKLILCFYCIYFTLRNVVCISNQPVSPGFLCLVWKWEGWRCDCWKFFQLQCLHEICKLAWWEFSKNKGQFFDTFNNFLGKLGEFSKFARLSKSNNFLDKWTTFLIFLSLPLLFIYHQCNQTKGQFMSKVNNEDL